MNFGSSKNLFGYADALEMVGKWANEFFTQYDSKMEDWDSFEESDDNIYNAISWDEFVTYWAGDRLKTYLSQLDVNPLQAFLGSSRFPKIIIVIKESAVSALYSSSSPASHRKKNF